MQTPHRSDPDDLRAPLPQLRRYELCYYPAIKVDGSLAEPDSTEDPARTVDVIRHGLTGDLVVQRFEREENRMVVNCRRLQNEPAVPANATQERQAVAA